MELSDVVAIVGQKWGWAGVVILFALDKLAHWAYGSTRKFIEAVNTNTSAVQKLQIQQEITNTNILKFQNDLRTAFFNIRELRDKDGLGPLSRPVDQ